MDFFNCKTYIHTENTRSVTSPNVLLVFMFLLFMPWPCLLVPVGLCIGFYERFSFLLYMCFGSGFFSKKLASVMYEGISLRYNVKN